VERGRRGGDKEGKNEEKEKVTKLQQNKQNGSQPLFI
jgi:hypothetical protein